MKIPASDPRLQQLSDDLLEAQQLSSRREYLEAKATFRRCFEEARKMGVNSGDTCWGIAVVSDFLGEFDDAVRYCRMALESDPLSPSYRNSWAVIGRRIRQALLDPARPDSDRTIAKLHALAVEVGVADDQAHLRMARHFLVVDRLDIGRPFLEGLVTLSPACIEAGVMLADVAIRLNDEELAERCGLAAAGRSGEVERMMLLPAAEA